jgi:hypothetical protein
MTISFTFPPKSSSKNYCTYFQQRKDLILRTKQFDDIRFVWDHDKSVTLLSKVENHAPLLFDKSIGVIRVTLDHFFDPLVTNRVRYVFLKKSTCSDCTGLLTSLPNVAKWGIQLKSNCGFFE